MGINTAPTVGRIRTTNGIASTLPRLERDAAHAKALAIKLEAEIAEPEEEVEKPEGSDEAVKAAAESGGEGAEPDAAVAADDAEEPTPKAKVVRGSEIVQGAIDRLIESEGLVGELQPEQAIRKVS